MGVLNPSSQNASDKQARRKGLGYEVDGATSAILTSKRSKAKSS